MSDPGRTKASDRLAALVLLAVSVTYGLASLPLRELPGYDVIGPAGFPALIAISGVILSLLLLLSPTNEPRLPMSGRRIWPCWFAFAVYCILVPFSGLGVGTFLFLLATFVLLGTSRVRAAATSAIVTAVLWILFKVILELRLSFGPWG